MVLIIFGAFIVALLLYGAAVDLRARRRGKRLRDGYGAARDVRDARRDVRAWDRGSMGHGGEDLSWMKRPGR